MAQLTIDSNNSLLYEYTPSDTSGACFVFYNALIGDIAMWEAEIAPAVRAQGHGTLLWNYRGQRESPAGDGVTIDDRLIRADGARLLGELAPERPIAVGLSIGGLFAAQQWLDDKRAVGLVLLNTLREPSARLDWINRASFEAARIGGLAMVKDLFSPLIFNHDWLRDNLSGAFASSTYNGLQAHEGHYRLLNDARGADWRVPYESLTLPVRVITGLQDNMFYEPDAVDRLAARLPNAKRIDLPDAGHMIPVERPQAVIDCLLDLADEIGSSHRR